MKTHKKNWFAESTIYIRLNICISDGGGSSETPTSFCNNTIFLCPHPLESNL